MGNNSVRYPTELRERAVRMVLEATLEGVYSSEWAAICAVAQMLGPTPETVCKWDRVNPAREQGKAWGVYPPDHLADIPLAKHPPPSSASKSRPFERKWRSSSSVPSDSSQVATVARRRV